MSSTMLDTAVEALSQRTSPLNSKHEHKNIHHYAPGICFRATPLVLKALFFLAWLIAGILCLAIKRTTITIAIGSALLGLWVLLFLFYLFPVFRAGLPCTMPKPPAPRMPFTPNTTTETVADKVKHTKIYVLYNPASGTGKSQNIVNNIVLPKLQALNLPHVLLPTRYAGHFYDYLYALPFEGYSGILIVGGDGSFYESVNGLLTRQKDIKLNTYPQQFAQHNTLHDIPLGLLPAGSGNSFMADLGTWNAEVAFDNFFNGSIIGCDVNQIQDLFGIEQQHAQQQQQQHKNTSTTTATTGEYTIPAEIKTTLMYKEQEPLDVYSINTCSFGLVGDLAVAAENNRWLGPKRYDVCGLWGLLKKSTYPTTILYNHNTKAPLPYLVNNRTTNNNNNNDNNNNMNKSTTNKDTYITLDNNGKPVQRRSQQQQQNQTIDNNNNHEVVNHKFVENEKSDTNTTNNVSPSSNNSSTDLSTLAVVDTTQNNTQKHDDGSHFVLRTQTDHFITAFANHTKYFGRGHYIAPFSAMNDGLCDVTIASAAPRGELMTIFQQIPSGCHTQMVHDCAQQFQTNELAFIPYDTHNERLLSQIREELQIFEYQQKDNKHNNVQGVINNVILPKYKHLFKQYFITIDGEIVPFYGFLYIKTIPNAIKLITNVQQPSLSNAAAMFKD